MEYGKNLTLQDSAIQTISSTAAQSAITGDSFEDALKNAATNLIINASGQIIANEIGNLAHTGQISKPTQLTLHAALGCGMAAAAGSDCAAGAAAGMAGELSAEMVYGGNNGGGNGGNNQGLNREQTILASQIAGALAAAMVAGPDDGASVFAGSQIGRNAAQNNAIKVWVQEVAVGNYHTSIKIEPEDQEKWKNDPKYGEYFNNKDHETGKYYATIGAGPDQKPNSIFGKLIGGETISGQLDGINRSRDVDSSNKVWVSQQLVPTSQEDSYIRALFNFNANYKNNLDYGLFPTKDSNSYNSNSYTSGLLNASRITPPELPKTIKQIEWQDWEYPERSGSFDIKYNLPQFQVPGYEKPVPLQNFGGKK